MRAAVAEGRADQRFGIDGRCFDQRAVDKTKRHLHLKLGHDPLLELSIKESNMAQSGTDMPWREAIIKILTEAGTALHYNEIAELVAQ